MKPASLADISYSQALQILGMRKEALDSGEVQRLPRHLLEDSYYFRDAGESLQEKRSFDFKKTLSDVWKNPTGKATLIGAGLGGVAGLGKTMADDEDDSYLGNIATGALGGGALGLGGGLAFDSKTRNSLVNKFQEVTNSGNGTAQPLSPDDQVNKQVNKQVTEAMNSGNPEQEFVYADNATNAADLNVLGRQAGVGATTVVPAGLAARRMTPGMGGIDVAGAKPQSVNFDTLSNLGNKSETLGKMLREGVPQPRSQYGFPDSQNLYGMGPPTKSAPPPTPPPAPKAPSLEQIVEDGLRPEKRLQRANVSEEARAMIDATKKSIPPTPPTPATQTASQEAARPRRSAAPVTGRLPFDHSKSIPGFDAAKQQVEAIMGKGKVKPEAVVAFMRWSSASSAQKAKIVKELGLEPGFLSGKVQAPEILAALTRRGDNVAKGELLTDRSRVNLGQAIGETIETKSPAPMQKVLRQLPKGKIGVLMAALGLGYGAASYTGQTAGLRNAKVTRDKAELYRRKLQEAISKGQNGK